MSWRQIVMVKNLHQVVMGVVEIVGAVAIVAGPRRGQAGGYYGDK